MPATRKSRTAAGPAAKGTQKTLAFNNTRITKPTTSGAASKTSKLDADLTPPPTKAIAVADLTPDVGHVSSLAAVQEQAKVEIASIKGQGLDVDRVKAEEEEDKKKTGTEEEVHARQVTDAQVKRYWKAREGERMAKRVHQEDLSVEEKVLRLFDMSSQYGPCIGIARMKRWVRANKLGLSPPIEVLAVLLKEEEKGHSGIERAYVDELLSSQQVAG